MARTPLTPLGHARVYRHPHTGELVVDTDSLRRSSFAGDFAGEDPGGDFEGEYDDDFEGEYDDDFEGEYDDDFGDDFGEDEDDDFGARRGRSRRRARRQARRARRQGRRANRRARRGGEQPKDQQTKWGMTAVGGTDTLSEAGAASVKIRLQHDFKAEDVTFTGSADGAKVTSIFFGDRVVWSNSDGIDVGVFASNSFMRGMLKGQSLRAGLDITVNGSTGGAGEFSVTIVGKKPVGR
jgi:hypothetical protein